MSKLKSSEKILIVALFIAILYYAGYTFLYTPLQEDIATSRTQVDALQKQKADAIIKINDIPAKQEEAEKLLKEIGEQSSPYFESYVHEEIIKYMIDLFTSSNLFVLEISTDGIELIDVTADIEDEKDTKYSIGEVAKRIRDANRSEDEEDTAEEETQAETEAEAETDDKDVINGAYIYTFEVSFTQAEYPQIEGFIKGLESLNKCITISDLEINYEEEDTEAGAGQFLAGTFTVNLYAIDKVTEDASPFPKVELTAPTGRIDPFAILNRN